MYFEPVMKKDYEWVNTISDTDYEVFLSFDGTPKSSNWNPVRVKRVRSDDRNGFLLSDFPWLGGHALVFRENVMNVLSDILQNCGEVLPLETEDGTSLYVHNTKVIDALDESNSKVIRFPSSKRIMRIISPKFITDKIGGANMFRLPYRSTPTYVSEKFVEKYNSSGLVGLEFKKVF